MREYPTTGGFSLRASRSRWKRVSDATAALGRHRPTRRKVPTGRGDEERLTADIIELARQYGRHGYRKIAALLRDAG